MKPEVPPSTFVKLEALPSKAELPASMQEAPSSMAELPASRAGASCFAMLEVLASVKAELTASLEAHAIPDCEWLVNTNPAVFIT